MWIALGIIMILGIVGISIWKSQFNTRVERMRVNGRKKGYSEDEIDNLVATEQFPLPSAVRPALFVLTLLFFGLGAFHQIFFYAEPGYMYHVRTILGQERAVDSVGYNYHLFGRINNWKKAMTVQATPMTLGTESTTTAESDGGTQASANLPPLSVVMLDQVDSKLSATTRFRIPTDRESFLKMAHEYRTPENLLRTALIPAFQETLQATGSLMAAEEYYSGRRTEFNAEFENQMQNGIYLVTRHQIVVDDPVSAVKGTAASDLGTSQADFGDGKKVKWVVEKKLRADGTFERKPQNFNNYGISVIEARVTDLKPNEKFVERMQLKQQAAADRAIAQEKRVQEEEQKLLAIAKGEREVAEQQAEAKKIQIKRTTDQETEKRLALIDASKKFEQAEIDKQTAQIRLEQARIDAEKVKTLADATSYEKRVVLEADNALAQKLETEIAIQRVWAEAYSKRAVPKMVFTSGPDGGVPIGGDTETSRFLQLLTADAAKRLSYDRGVDAPLPVK